jgi:ribosomal subunit interface protein
MDLIIKSRNGSKISEHQRRHIEEKLGRLERYMDQIKSATVEVYNEQQRQAGEVFRIQVTVVGDHGVILRAEEQSSDLMTAVDEVQDVLQRQIKRYKEKYWRRSNRLRRQDADRISELEATISVAESVDVGLEEAPEPKLIRTKQFKLRPMFTDDAVEQMELLGHTFFVFQDAETSKISVLYRRRDGNYGLIIPDPV